MDGASWAPRNDEVVTGHIKSDRYAQCTGRDPVIITFPNYTVRLNIDNHLEHAFYSTFDFNLLIKHSRRMSKAPRVLL